MSVLPEKLSALIRVAVADLEKVESDRQYKVKMSSWHCPVAGRCEVCLAGAVMAMSLGAPVGASCLPNGFEDEDRGLRALDYVRQGYVSVTLGVLGVAWPKMWYEDVTPYKVSGPEFKTQLLGIATKLEVKGL